MTNEAVILAGGKGTRLQSVVSDIPKPMAPVRGVPFLEYQLKYLIAQGINHIVLSVGFKKETIIDHFGDEFQGIQLSYAVEETPLGTGGGIKLAAEKIKGERFWVLNGDSVFRYPMQDHFKAHNDAKAILSLALKPMKDFSRYGTVEVDEDQKISAFLEKQQRDFGLINAGVYLVEQTIWDQLDLEGRFSFETDLMEKEIGKLEIYGFPYDGYFIDIGIPEDYERAQDEFARFED